MELVILIGLQASGKTTFYRERYAATHAHLSMDLWPNARRPRQRLARELEAALTAGRDVVIDNTNPCRADRAPLIAAGRRAGARVRAMYFVTTLGDARARNSRRSGRARVPDVALHSTVRKIEAPELEEGFEKIERVRLGEAGFEVLDQMP